MNVLFNFVRMKDAQKFHPIKNVEFCRKSVEIGLELTFPNYNRVSIDVLHCAQKDLITLVTDEPADRDHKPRVLLLQAIDDFSLR